MTKRFSPIALAFISALAISGCKSRLNADFEADAVGSHPNEYPAGPEDDRIYVVEHFGSGTALVTSDEPLAGEQSIKLMGPGASANGNDTATMVLMYAEKLQYKRFKETVYASWKGKLSPHTGATWLLSDGHFDTLVEIKLISGKFFVNGVLTGTYTPGKPHGIMIAMHRNGRFDAGIVGDGAGGSVYDHPLLSTFDHDAVQLRASLVGGTSASYYMFDDVNISEREPWDLPIADRP